MRRLFATVLTTLVAVPALGACDGGGGGEVEAYCDAIRSFQEIESQIGTPNFEPGASFEEQMQAMRESFEPLKDRLEDLRRVAPSAIRSEVRQLADVAEDLLDAFLQAGSVEDFADPGVAQRISDLQQEVSEARDTVAEFTEDECGIDLDPATGS